MATQSIDSTIGALNSWKEIASYMGRGVRTVQRYEVGLGLPVLRVAGRSHSSVVAFKNDLDEWLRKTVSRSVATTELRGASIIAELRESLSTYANLRAEARSLVVAHRSARLELRTSVARIMEEIHSPHSANSCETGGRPCA